MRTASTASTSARTRLLAAGLLALAACAAQAQQPQAAPGAPGAPTAASTAAPAGAHAGHHRMDPAQREARRAARLAELKTKLAIAPQQEPAWTAFTAAMKPAARPQRPDRAEFAALTTPQRIDRMRAFRAERQASMDRRLDAVKTFYAALTPEQQKTFDAQPMPRFGGHGHHHGHGHPGRGHGAQS